MTTFWRSLGSETIRSLAMSPRAGSMMSVASAFSAISAAAIATNSRKERPWRGRWPPVVAGMSAPEIAAEEELGGMSYPD